MKSITLVSVGLLSSAVAAIGVTGYFAWKSLSGEAEFSPIATQPIAQSQASVLPPASQPIVAVSTSSQPATPVVDPAHASTHSQSENDYLFDLSQALQPTERDRLSAAEQLQLGRKIVSWLASGADYWTVRQQFDAAFQNSIVGNYPHNRDVYIKFATQHFGPSYQATLTPPVETSLPVNSRSEMPLPYGMPSPYDLPVPYGVPEEAYSEPMPLPPFPEAHLHPPFYPEAAPYFPPHFYAQPERPADQPPRSPYQTPNQPYPNSPYPAPRNPMPRQAPQPNSNDSGIPGAIEISAPDRSQVY